MDDDQRICPRCGKPAGDFHFCPSCLAPIDSLSAILTSRTLRPEHALAESDGHGDHIAGHDSAAVLQVESDRPPVEDMPAQPNAAGGEGSELQLHLDGRVSVPPPSSREVARLEDVLTVGPKTVGDHETADAPTASAELPIRVDPRVSVPPPAAREVARLEDVLTPASADDAARIAPKTAAAANPVEAVVEVEAVPEESPVAETTPPPVEAVAPATIPPRQAGDRRYVPAYALRAAFWFEQASAFESSSDDHEDEVAVAAVAPEVEPAHQAADVISSHIDPDPGVGETLVQTPRNHWMLALCLLALAGLVIVLTGRRPCRCTGKAAS